MPASSFPHPDAFAVYCEQGALALMMFAVLAGESPALRPSKPARPPARLHTGYLPKAQRNTAAHGMYNLGIWTPERETADDRAKASARKWGLAS